MNSRDSIESEIAELLRQKSELEVRIAALRKAKRVLEKADSLLGATSSIAVLAEGRDVGITDAIRGAFRQNPERTLTPIEVRDIISSHGFDLAGYRNAMAAIHQVISRLASRDEIRHTQGNGMPGYRWTGIQRNR
jgi:hypothetical protein